MPTERRIARMEEVLSARLGWVCCAVEAVYHRHNASAILRTCDALGVHRVHLVEGRFRPSKGAARGAERWLDLRRAATPEVALEELARDGYAVWIADLTDDALPPEEVPLDEPVCLWLGAELVGVGPEARAAARGVVKLPMRGFVQSLNVSVAAALALRPLAERARVAQGERALLAPDVRTATMEQWLADEAAMRKGVQARMALDGA